MEASSNSNSNYNNNLLNINTLSADLYASVTSFCDDKKINDVDKNCAALGDKIIIKAYEDIAKLYNPLNNIVAKKVEEEIPPKRIFMQCVNRLYDRAREVGHTAQYSLLLTTIQRMDYELAHYQDLINSIKEKEQLIKLFQEMLDVVELGILLTEEKKDDIKYIIDEIKLIITKKSEILVALHKKSPENNHVTVLDLSKKTGWDQDHFINHGPLIFGYLYQGFEAKHNLKDFFNVIILNSFWQETMFELIDIWFKSFYEDSTNFAKYSEEYVSSRRA